MSPTGLSYYFYAFSPSVVSLSIALDCNFKTIESKEVKSRYAANALKLPKAMYTISADSVK